MAGVVAWLALVGSLQQPAVQYFYDAVGIRDAGTVWPSLGWRLADQKHFLPAAVLGHIEGPLQLLVLNGYYFALGDRLPLDPQTTHVPNVVFALLTALVLWRLGRALGSPGDGAMMALAFVFMPWLGPTVRVPWVFNTATCLFHALTLLAYVRFALDPASRRWRFAAPAALAGYWLTGLEWPAFMLALGLFLLLSGRVRAALANRWNVLPAAVVLLYLGWSAALFVYGRFVNPAHAHLWHASLLVYPFYKLVTVTAPQPLPAPPSELLSHVARALGLALPLAVAGAVLAWWPGGRARGDDEAARVRRALVITLTVWAFVFVVFPLRTWWSVTYFYTVAVPLAALAGLALGRLAATRWGRVAAVALVVVMAALQARLVIERARQERHTQDVDDRRVLAAAAFLIERRGDLLQLGRRALLPRNDGANVGQYARGLNDRIIMPVDFPAEMVLRSVGSKEDVLKDFVTTYTSTGRIKADWLVLTEDLLKDRRFELRIEGEREVPAPAAPFYRALAADPQIAWVACFRDADNRRLWLGEVKPGGPALDAAPVVEVEPLADLYTRKYDRISFLKQNVRHVLHY